LYLLCIAAPHCYNRPAFVHHTLPLVVLGSVSGSDFALSEPRGWLNRTRM
jgi:hypothetical protein